MAERRNAPAEAARSAPTAGHRNASVAGSDPYELFAIRYATAMRSPAEVFIGADPHDGPMPMDYFVWVARSRHHTVVIDTGFDAHA
ncbi:MAG TPA: hypothetical protein VMB48_07745, partial [Steroidobacteraceae bacterium]|nr:hypothetical protein [Steroidobacteraceae bacterium]